MDEKRRSRRWLTWLVVGLVAYPLSAGPVFWMYKLGPLPIQQTGNFIYVFYYPLNWLVDNGIEPFASCFRWYTWQHDSWPR